MTWQEIFSWIGNNIFAISALGISLLVLWNNSYRIKNKFKAILIHEDMEDFFILQNDGNRDQILLDYFYGYKHHPKEDYVGILTANNADPIVIKPGQKHIVKPRWSLTHFIRSRTEPGYSYKDGPVIIEEIHEENTKEVPFIVGMAFKYISSKGKVKVKYFNYAIYTKESLILEDKILDKGFIYLNK